MDRRVKLPDRYVDVTGREVKRTGDWVKEFDLVWPVHEYEIAEKPVGDLVVTFGRRRIWAENQSEPPGSRLWTTFMPRPSMGWPPGGLFVYKGYGTGQGFVPMRSYRPLEEAEEILKEVTRLNADDTNALLAFVNRWGRLGIGIPGNEWYLFDGVEQTRHALKLVRVLAEMWFDFGRRPRLELRSEFCFALTAGLRGVHPALRPESGQFPPVYRLHSVRDALYLQLWEHVTEAKKYRRCADPKCKSLFVRNRADQWYCSERCQERVYMERYRAKPRRKSGRRNRRANPGSRT